MKLGKTIEIDAALETVWALLKDPHRLAACVPGASFDEELEDGSYAGSIRFKFGPKVVTFTGAAALTTDDEAHTGQLTANGKDRNGASRARLDMTFSASEDAGGDGSQARTVVTIDSNARFTGALASFAETGGVRVAEALLGEFAQNVSNTVGQPADAPAAPAADGQPAAAAPAEPKPLSAGWLVLQVLRGFWTRLVSRVRRLFSRSSGKDGSGG